MRRFAKWFAPRKSLATSAWYLYERNGNLRPEAILTWISWLQLFCAGAPPVLERETIHFEEREAKHFEEREAIHFEEREAKHFEERETLAVGLEKLKLQFFSG